MPHNIPNLAPNALFRLTGRKLYTYCQKAKVTPVIPTSYSHLYRTSTFRRKIATKIDFIKRQLNLQTCIDAVADERFWDLFFMLRYLYKEDGLREQLYLLIGNMSATKTNF
jgi:hypothetical protein